MIIQCFNTGEWISGPVCMYIARYFANPPSDEVVWMRLTAKCCFMNTPLQIALLLSKIEFIMVPVANPDGYHVRKILAVNVPGKYCGSHVVCNDYIHHALIPDLKQMLYQLSCKYSSAGWAKSQRQNNTSSCVCCVYTCSWLGCNIPSIGSGGKTQYPPTTLTAMEWTSIETLMPTGVWYGYTSNCIVWMNVPLIY